MRVSLPILIAVLVCAAVAAPAQTVIGVEDTRRLRRKWKIKAGQPASKVRLSNKIRSRLRGADTVHARRERF
jgi:hypothetical protein